MRVNKIILCVTLFLSLLVFSACQKREDNKIIESSQIQEPPKTEIVSEISLEDMKEVNMSREQKRKINIFLSNFSECFIKFIDVDFISDKDLIYFAIMHNFKNNDDLFLDGDDDSTMKISEEYIEKTINKYFDINEVVHQTIPDKAIYKDGYYFKYRASNDVKIPVVQIYKLYDNGNHEYIAYGNIYTDANYVYGDLYEPVEYWSSDAKSDMKISGQVEAKFKAITNGNIERYVIINYNEKNN